MGHLDFWAALAGLLFEVRECDKAGKGTAPGSYFQLKMRATTSALNFHFSKLLLQNIHVTFLQCALSKALDDHFFSFVSSFFADIVRTLR